MSEGSEGLKKELSIGDAKAIMLQISAWLREHGYGPSAMAHLAGVMLFVHGTAIVETHRHVESVQFKVANQILDIAEEAIGHMLAMVAPDSVAGQQVRDELERRRQARKAKEAGEASP